MKIRDIYTIFRVITVLYKVLLKNISFKYRKKHYVDNVKLRLDNIDIYG